MSHREVLAGTNDRPTPGSVTIIQVRAGGENAQLGNFYVAPNSIVVGDPNSGQSYTKTGAAKRRAVVNPVLSANGNVMSYDQNRDCFMGIAYDGISVGNQKAAHENQGLADRYSIVIDGLVTISTPARYNDEPHYGYENRRTPLENVKHGDVAIAYAVDEDSFRFYGDSNAEPAGTYQPYGIVYCSARAFFNMDLATISKEAGVNFGNEEEVLKMVIGTVIDTGGPTKNEIRVMVDKSLRLKTITAASGSTPGGVFVPPPADSPSKPPGDDGGVALTQLRKKLAEINAKNKDLEKEKLDAVKAKLDAEKRAAELEEENKRAAKELTEARNAAARPALPGKTTTTGPKAFPVGKTATPTDPDKTRKRVGLGGGSGSSMTGSTAVSCAASMMGVLGSCVTDSLANVSYDNLSATEAAKLMSHGATKKDLAVMEAELFMHGSPDPDSKLKLKNRTALIERLNAGNVPKQVGSTDASAVNVLFTPSAMAPLSSCSADVIKSHSIHDESGNIETVSHKFLDLEGPDGHKPTSATTNTRLHIYDERVNAGKIADIARECVHHAIAANFDISKHPDFIPEFVEAFNTDIDNARN